MTLSGSINFSLENLVLGFLLSPRISRVYGNLLLQQFGLAVSPPPMLLPLCYPNYRKLNNRKGEGGEEEKWFRLRLYPGKKSWSRKQNARLRVIVVRRCEGRSKGFGSATYEDCVAILTRCHASS